MIYLFFQKFCMLLRFSQFDKFALKITVSNIEKKLTIYILKFETIL